MGGGLERMAVFKNKIHYLCYHVMTLLLLSELINNIKLFPVLIFLGFANIFKNLFLLIIGG